MGVATGDTSLSDCSPASSGDDEKQGDWCIPSCSVDAEEEEELSSSKTSDGNEGAEAKERRKKGQQCKQFTTNLYKSEYDFNILKMSL